MFEKGSKKKPCQGEQGQSFIFGARWSDFGNIKILVIFSNHPDYLRNGIFLFTNGIFRFYCSSKNVFFHFPNVLKIWVELA